MDRPHLGGGGNSRYSSPDSAGRVYYGGDESKEIGLFKFKLGLFKFVLPTFNGDDAAWERTNELSSLMTVPSPRNKRRKHNNGAAATPENNFYLRLRGAAQGQSKFKIKKSKDQGKKKTKNDRGKQKPSIAYVVVMPNSMHLATNHFQTTSAYDKTAAAQNDPSFPDRAKVLRQSIEKAHSGSPYEYQLYARNILMDESNQNATDHKKNITEPSNEIQDVMMQSGYQIINANAGQLNIALNRLRSNEPDHPPKESDKQQTSLPDVLNQHDVVVQMSLNSFLLNPLDNLFDTLIKGTSPDSLVGNFNVTEIIAAANATPAEESESNLSESTPSEVDSFLLESLGTTTAQDELYIFRSSSQEAMRTYLESLQCMISSQAKGVSSGAHPVRSDRVPKKLRLSVMVSRKNQEVDKQVQDSLSKEQCKLQNTGAIKLNTCLYDVLGSVDKDHDCSHFDVKRDARVARFPVGSAVPVTNSNSDDAKKANGKELNNQCMKPWENSSKGECSKSNAGQKNDAVDSEDDVCIWVCREWFSFGDQQEVQ